MFMTARFDLVSDGVAQLEFNATVFCDDRRYHCDKYLAAEVCRGQTPRPGCVDIQSGQGQARQAEGESFIVMPQLFS